MMVGGDGGLPGRLPALMGNPHNIRNLCIMAHVDHGKTSLADSLVASNGLIAHRQAGKIRYMDSRKDEMERGITMKSSCVSLAYSRPDGEYIINLIDSPGHVDFSSEVSTAVRLCDGTIIVVDVVEGVCAQTKVVLQQAWVENIRPVLVLNKIDRLILETKLSPIDCYYHIAQILEQVNAYMGEQYNTAVLGKTSEEVQRRQQAERERKLIIERERKVSECETPEAQLMFADWGIETVDDSDLYFSPERGNVVFASAYDGWGFSIHHFADLYSAKLGMNKAVLNKTLWGDNYIATKGGQKRIMSGARDKRKNPLFVTLILENLYKVYDNVMVRKDKGETEKLAEALGVKMPMSVLKSTDMRLKLNFLCSGWLPLATAVLEMVVEHLPSAANMSEDRATKLMCSATQRFDSLPPETQKLKESFVRCSSDENEPLIVYVSKMFGVQRQQLPKERSSGNKIIIRGKSQGILSDEEIATRREELRRRKEAAAATVNTDSGQERAMSSEEIDELKKQQEEIILYKQKTEEEKKKLMEEEVFVAFARVFSGTLKAGQKVYVLGPKHDPSLALNLMTLGDEQEEESLKGHKHIHVCQISEIYLLLGREFERLECAAAGSVVGITGLEGCIIKSATLSSTLAMPPFTELTLSATPILRVAVEPHDPRDLPKLRAGLKLLNQADPCVQVALQKSGEYVILTAGEVHLQRCVDDLQERYAGVPVRISDPIVPFRETIISQPTVDRLNEAIEGENINFKKVDNSDPLGVVEISGHFGKLRCRAVPLPDAVTKLLEQNEKLLKLVSKAGAIVTDATNAQDGSGREVYDDSSLKDDDEQDTSLHKDALSKALENRQKLNRETFQAITEFKMCLDKAFKSAGDEWQNAVNEIWNFGPHGCGANILLNHIPAYPRPSIWEKATLVDCPLAAYDTNFVTGFQIATAAGPLCEEPMMGVCFIIEDWKLAPTNTSINGVDELQTFGMSSGHIISLSKDTLRKAFEQQCQRLVCAMYSCVISVTSEVVGKMYSVIGKRQGQIVDGDITEGSTSWNITAYLPVIESMNFANELRKSTSGEAMPQLVFSHWEILNIDPFWEPQTTEEVMHWGEKSDSENVARKYINAVRKRKGLAIDEKIVEFAEKQRTLSKNK
ncbi:elongation factor-like GTPase 1 [Homarus americanus]|uniref:Ribosome assembly protein 1 n=1 Tax=Homarus americanus TaxID=6706 RepID=A0A8J5NF01_HOMAM|nr:elongation factor-like GTPase 1 [Homarus americanus]KAG7178014.1 Elongation factor-like GTPase 1-like [Homarus americanus]